MSAHHDDKKAKKLAQLLKNKKFQAINLLEDQLARGRDLEKEREDEVRQSMEASSRRASDAHAAKNQTAWSAKLQMVRDKNTGRERMMKERWNRFAGTAEAGGRGL